MSEDLHLKILLTVAKLQTYKHLNNVKLKTITTMCIMVRKSNSKNNVDKL